MMELPDPYQKNDRPKVYRIEPMIELSHPHSTYQMSHQDIAIEEAKY